MKCQNCDGNGRFEVEDNGVVMQGVYWRCPNCGGKGIVEPLTNEEWLKRCTTEQLADVFFDYRYVNATPQQQLWLSANEDFVKGGIVEWLKQPHSAKE